jgi:tripartite-type tricarboxylate transporter receptor subunit TctC
MVLAHGFLVSVWNKEKLAHFQYLALTDADRSSRERAMGVPAATVIALPRSEPRRLYTGMAILVASWPRSIDPGNRYVFCVRVAANSLPCELRTRTMWGVNVTPLLRTLTVVIVALLLVLPAARANDIADFYRGRQVDLIVGNSPGGGYDVYARLLARHIGKYIPGNPNVVVQNMPGAGSLRAANYIYSVAPKDGTTFGLFARDLVLVALIGGNPAVQFDPRKFTWLGSSSTYANDAYLLMLRKDAAVKTIDDARRPGGPTIVLGASAEGASGDDVPIMLRDLLGLHMKLIAGYRDSAALFMAVDQKEVDGRTVGLSAVRSAHPQWLGPNSDMRVLVQFARATRLPEFPDVPTARELAPNDRARALIELAELPYYLSRPFAAPPGVPSERAKVLATAFLATQRDPQYLAEAEKLKVDISPISGDDVLHAIERMAQTPSELRDALNKLLAQK